MDVKAKIAHFPLERVKSMVEADRFVIQQGRARVFLGGTFQESRTVMKEVIVSSIGGTATNKWR
jgi:hypothetical protein